MTSVDLPATELALRISMHGIDFGEVKLLTSEEFTPQDKKIKVSKIAYVDHIGYSRFIINDLYRYINTKYCSVIQADGFVLNAQKWQDKFLEYDYIGAPWSKIINIKSLDNNINEAISLKNLVGNGGFSLRSKKLLHLTSKIDLEKVNFPTKSEDLIICHFLFQEMVKNGIKFSSPELAAQFSVESQDASYGQNPNTSFGFHGKLLRDHIFGMILNNQKNS